MRVLPAGTIKRIHVNGANLRLNKRTRPISNFPVFTVKNRRDNIKGNLVEINGPVILIYDPHKPMKSGAVAWMETKAEVIVK